MRSLLLFLLLPAGCFCQAFSSGEIERYQSRAKQVTIIRDQWGVPHIYGKTDADAVFGLMYAQCEDNFKQVEVNFIEMLGRLSEVQGEEQVYNDLQMKLIYDTAAAMADYQKSPAWLRKLMDASADGLNFFLYKHPEVKPLLLTRFEPWFALLRTDGSIGATQTGGLTMQDIKELYPLKNSSTSFVEHPAMFYERLESGSNGFAVAPSKTASGNTILYINPHTTFYYRPEVHMVSEEGLNAYGAVTWGTFFVYQGFNEYCGWMHTSSYADVADLFEMKVVTREQAFTYEYDGKVWPFDRKDLVVRFKKGNEMLQHAFPTARSIHGPVVGSRNGKLLSLKENNRSMESLIQSWQRTKARGLADYKKAMDIRANNSNNTVFADNSGNIAYWHGNFMPVRNSTYDYSGIVDGSVSKTSWKGLHSVSETVHVYNPGSGWIQNCNSTPFTVSGASSPKKEKYPVYMAPDGENFRGLNAARLLSRASRLTIDRMIREIGYNQYLAAFDELLPSLFKAYDETVKDDSFHLFLAEPIRMLKVWDRSSSASSIATTIAIELAQKMSRHASPATNPYFTTHALLQIRSMITNTTPVQKLQLMKEVINELKKTFGSWQVAWGDVNRYQRIENSGFDDTKWSLPVGMAPGTWGALPSYQSRRYPNTSRRYGTSGNSFIACVEFGKKVKAKSVITGGQSFDPSSGNYTDQASMYLTGQFKDVLFYKEDVLKHATRTYHPGE